MSPTGLDPSPLPIAYQRRRRVPAGLFAGRFITLATLGLLAGGGLAALDVGVIAVLFLRGRALVPPVDLVLLTAVRLTLDAMLIVGCLRTLARRQSARRTLRTFVIGEGVEIVLTVVAMLAAAATLGSARVRDAAPILLLLAARGSVALVARSAERSAHADFYFDDCVAGIEASLPTIDRAAMPSPARFRVRGVDRATGEETTFESRAATIDAARRSAESFGLDAATITIDALETPAT